MIFGAVRYNYEVRKKFKNDKKYFFIAAVLVIVMLAGIFYFQKPIQQGMADVLFNKGNYYFNTGKYNLDKARNFYELALKIHPQVQGPHYQLSRIYFLKGDFAK